MFFTRILGDNKSLLDGMTVAYPSVENTLERACHDIKDRGTGTMRHGHHTPLKVLGRSAVTEGVVVSLLAFYPELKQSPKEIMDGA